MGLRILIVASYSVILAVLLDVLFGPELGLPEIPILAVVGIFLTMIGILVVAHVRWERCYRAEVRGRSVVDMPAPSQTDDMRTCGLSWAFTDANLNVVIIRDRPELDGRRLAISEDYWLALALFAFAAATGRFRASELYQIFGVPDVWRGRIPLPESGPELVEFGRRELKRLARSGVRWMKSPSDSYCRPVAYRDSHYAVFWGDEIVGPEVAEETQQLLSTL